MLGNLSNDYLRKIIKDLEQKAMDFRVLYTHWLNQIEDQESRQLGSYIMSGLAKASHSVGEAIAKNSVLSKGPVDEALLLAGDKLVDYKEERTKQNLQKIINSKENVVKPFVDSLKRVDQIYNQQLEIAFNENSVYLKCIG